MQQKVLKMYLTMTVDEKKTVTFYERILMNKKAEALKKIQFLY